jgi:amino-acid N-acetyltransferase
MRSPTPFEPLPLIRAAPLISFRAATEAHVWPLTALIAEHVRAGGLLPRSAGDIRTSLRTWIVAEVDGTLAGCGALRQIGHARMELRSLVVRSAYRGYGIGATLVRTLVARAWQAQADTVYALTRTVPFFARLGFVVTDLALLNEKVARDCMSCPLRTHCDETAMWLHRP